jgi:hypothetical protein
VHPSRLVPGESKAVAVPPIPAVESVTRPVLDRATACRFNIRVSTVDPVARERDPAYAARLRTRWWILMLAASVLSGYGCSIFGDFPGSSFSFGLTDLGPLLKTVLAVGGLVAAMIILSVVVRLPKRPGLVGQQLFALAVALLAYTAGFFVGTLLPTVIPDYADADLRPSRTTVRMFCGVLLVAVVVMVGLAALTSRRSELRERLRATGRRVSAEVTEVHDTGITTNNAPRVRLTVQFVDSHGTARYVRRSLYVSRLSRPAVGDHVALWYDPQDPGNVKKIVLGTA